ncbi:hypothetical protein AeRB84_008152 [Aphanomyces euteiches]|nr:hypothetical protein AeRB84_008152 [Aphanomyces euteiches]
MKTALPLLTVGVVMNIAFAIPDAADLFAFLEVLRPYDNLGPLEQLYQLGLTASHADLWPTLCTKSSVLGTPEVENFSADQVIWLETHVNPTTEITWRSNEEQVKFTPRDNWYELRITRLIFYSDDYSDLAWKSILPRLSYLRSLKVFALDSDWDYFCQFAATTNQLRELTLLPSSYKMSIADVVNLTKWLRHQPVRTLECCMCDWNNLNLVTRQEFYEALLNCPTLDKLTFWDSWLEDLDVTKFSLAMRSLSLICSCDSSRNVQRFASRLVGSNLTELEISGYNDENTDGMQCLLQALPQTSIKHLKLTGDTMTSPSWTKLASFFRNCPLKTLKLGYKSIPSEFAQSLAEAIQCNQTICELDLGCSEVTLPDLELLIQSLTHSSRSVKSNRMKLITPSSRPVDASFMLSMRDLAKQYKEFIHVPRNLKPKL